MSTSHTPFGTHPDPRNAEVRRIVEEGFGQPDDNLARPEAILEFGYTNWRGEYLVRKVRPIMIWFGSTSWHPEPQWLLNGIDLEKNAERDFAIKDMGIRHEGKADRYADALTKLHEASELAIAALPEEQRGGTVGEFLSAIRDHAAGALQ